MLALCSVQSQLAGASAQTLNGGSLVFGEADVLAGCRNYFAVSTKLGYSIVERLGGAAAIQRDSLSGPIEKIGPGQITDETQHQPISVYVREVHLSQQQFQARIIQLCH
jgi:hypothetical protein